LSLGNTIGMTQLATLLSGALGSWFPVHGPGHDGPGTPGQVSCSGMEKVLSLEDATN